MGLLVVGGRVVVVFGLMVGVIGSGSTKIQCRVLVLSVTFSVWATEVEVVVEVVAMVVEVEVVVVEVEVVVVEVVVVGDVRFNSSLTDTLTVISLFASF